MVIMDRQDYINKANQLLNQDTYKAITKDPTNTIKNKLINILKNIKTKTGLGTNTYKSMYPTGCVPPKFYGLPKIHKPDTPLRPIVSSCGSVTYGVAKELAKILKPLVGKSPHHINSTQDFVEQAKQFKLEPGECLSSYDVSALFTSVLIDPAHLLVPVWDLGCDDEYIGETSRTFGERYKEHLKAPSAIHHHSIQTGHTTNQNNFQIIGREGQNLDRNIKESIYIRVNNPSLNNNIGKFNLSYIWDRVLLNTKGLTLK